jgi:replication factor C large subunit
MEDDWTEKYRPKTFGEIVGNEGAISTLSEWGRNWGAEKKAAILYGRPGIGKTSAAYALANEMNWDVVELNASDKRRKGEINKIVGSASLHGYRPTLIIIDEADNIHGDADRGGVNAIVNVIKNTAQPIVLIANDYYGMKKSIRNLCKPIQFRVLRKGSIVSALRRICSVEDIIIDDDAMALIADGSKGDLRSAINDLQAVSIGRKIIKKEDVVIGKRNREESIFNVLAKIFCGDAKDALYSFYDISEDPEDFIHWLDENVPRVYEGDDIRKAFEYLSTADLFLGRTMRRQSYGLWRYATFLMIYGVGASKSREYERLRYNPPSRPRPRRYDSMSAKIGEACHVSERYARAQMIPFLETLCKKREYAIGIASSLHLSIEEIETLIQKREDAISIFNAAKKEGQWTLLDFG